MAATTATILAATAATAAAAGSVYGGVQAKKAGDKQSRLAREQAAMSAAETMRQAERSAVLERRNIDDVVDRQKLAYLASGVTLEGSPLLKMEETRRLGAENIEEIMKAGEAGSQAQLFEGRYRSQVARDSGRQALIGGLIGAAQYGSTALTRKAF